MKCLKSELVVRSLEFLACNHRIIGSLFFRNLLRCSLLNLVFLLLQESHDCGHFLHSLLVHCEICIMHLWHGDVNESFLVGEPEFGLHVLVGQFAKHGCELDRIDGGVRSGDKIGYDVVLQVPNQYFAQLISIVLHFVTVFSLLGRLERLFQDFEGFVVRVGLEVLYRGVDLVPVGGALLDQLGCPLDEVLGIHDIDVVQQVG